MVKNRKLIFAVILVLLCGTAKAHRLHHGSSHGCMRPVTTVVKSPPSKRTTVVTHLTKKDRIEMAIAYLRINRNMSVRQYSKITGLKKSVAEAELNVFAHDALNPIRPVPGKKNLYYLKG